jgi:hypothetical protein
MLDIEKLFWDIYNAKSEEELNNLVNSNVLLNNNNNWKPYGRDDKNNFGTFENQQSKPVPALVEKITNSIDSLLLKKCRTEKIDPRSKAAPKTMEEAVEKFYGIKNGDFSEVSTSERRGIAEDIQIIATGEPTSPNITIYDNGEGQHPSDFPNTFLSLYSGNKTDIPFVQGKYNMGSTGAVVFCGKKNRYQLIGSKLQTELADGRSSNEFGFTLVRRHPLTNEEEKQFKVAWYEYFLVNDEIPRFDITEIELGLWERKFTCGSIVKLYSYQLPSRSRSDITLDLWRDLNQYLYHPALPILLYEKRFTGGHTPTKLMLGNKTRLVLDERDKKTKTVTISIEGPEIGIVPIEYTVFEPGVKQSEFIKDKAVVFTINGQVQGKLERRFISQDLGYSMLRDSLLIQIDCTNIKPSFRQDLFMASRDRLKESENTETLINRIISVLKSDETLKELNQERKAQLLHENLQDTELIKEIMSHIPVDKDLLEMLKKGGDLNFLKKKGGTINGTKGEKKENKHPFVSKRFPSVFKIDLKSETPDGNKIKNIPLNGKGIIKFETDVEDEYLFRPQDKGELQLQILSYRNNITKGGTNAKPNKIEDVIDVTKVGPSDNVIKITFEPKNNVFVGDEFEISAILTSPGSNLESIFWVKIVDPKKEEPLKEKEKQADMPSLPKPVKVYEKKVNVEDATWNDFNWSGDDIVKIVPQTDSQNQCFIDLIAINMDSFQLKKFISKNKISSEKEIKLVRDKYFLSVYLHTLFLYSIIENLDKTNETENKFDPEDLIPLIMKPYSSFLLASNTDDAILNSLKED